MRVAQVTGHYPPNFISGGTLVPQRLAQAAARAGHHSFVFAGRLDDASLPLTTSIETDEAGVQVTWVTTTPWTNWADRHNFDNPSVEAAFRQWLDLVDPDVVHFHSIQTLGAGLLRAAHESGARVIVTMHDFWWFCARQFLVDPSMTPCSLVTDCGVCACESGLSARIDRGAFLRGELQYADIILAPSRIARDVFVANGVEPSRIRVDENGIDADDHGRAVIRTGVEPDSPIRAFYAGGPQPLKGWVTLRNAAILLGEIEGLVLDAYGTSGDDTKGLPSWVRALPPYDRSSVGEVLASHDFLVLPSIMRESHSIVTREALGAGLAVVCTDTLGPEEAVTHGVNGMVVPAGDSAALAQALASLAGAPATARELMGKGSASPIRTLADQVEHDLALYEELSAPRPRVSHAQTRLVSRVLFVVGIDGAPLRYRARLPAEALALQGVHSDVVSYLDPSLPFLTTQADAVVFYRVPATNQVLDLLADIKRRRTVPVLFDVDDLIFDPSLRGQLDGLNGLSKDENDLWWRGVARYRTTMEACDAFIGSTQRLCDSATSLTGMKSYRFPNGVGMLLAQRSDAALRAPRAHGPLRIGYFSGTTTHDADWALIEGAVIATLARYPHAELWVGGHVHPSPSLIRLGSRVRRIPFTTWYDLPTVLRDTDICVAPLTPNGPFNEAKSAIKWLEAALVATPTIASPTQPFQDAIEHGRTGILASTPEEWEAAFTRLLDSEFERSRIGSQARRDALLGYSPAIQGRLYLSILTTAAMDVRSHGHRKPTDWINVVGDERFDRARSQLEEYQVPNRMEADSLPLHIRLSCQQLLTLAKDQGAVGLAEHGFNRSVTLLKGLSRTTRDEGLAGIAKRAHTHLSA